MEIRERFMLVILAGLVQSGTATAKDRFWHVLARLQPEMFTEKLQPLYAALVRYFQLTGEVIDAEDLDVALRGIDVTESKRFEYGELYKKLAAATEVTTPKFKFFISSLLEEIKKETLGETLTDAMVILSDGKLIKGKPVKGYDAAVKYLAQRETDLERLSGVFPEGNMMEEVGGMFDEYRASKADRSTTYIQTGISEIDEATFGIAPGDLWLLGAYTSEGKTTLLENVAYHAAFILKKNVVFATAESTRVQVRRKIACLHSRRSPRFEGRALRYKDVKGGMLTVSEEAIYQEVLEDIHQGWRSGEYGRVHIFQMPYKATVNYIYNRLRAYSTMFSVDLFCLDYLNLVHSDRKREQKREELDDVIVAMKQIAVDFEGKGLGVISPWQIKQIHWENAKKEGHYTLACLSNTSESERSADVVWTMLRMPGEEGVVRTQLLKNRDGEVISTPFELEADFGYCYVGSKSEQTELLEVDEVEDEETLYD